MSEADQSGGMGMNETQGEAPPSGKGEFDARELDKLIRQIVDKVNDYEHSAWLLSREKQASLE